MTVTENKQKQFFSKRNLIIIGIALLLITAIVIIVILITGNPKVPVLTSEEISSTAAAIAQATLGAASTTSNQTFNQLSSSTNAPTTYGTGGIGITRSIDPFTEIPDRNRMEVIQYEVQQGDNIYSIADFYGITPETVFWGNEDSLDGDPRTISIGQKLNILPVNGVYYKYEEGKSIREIASEYYTSPEDILNFPTNGLDPYLTDIDQPLIDVGQYLVLPNAIGETVDFGPPKISCENPAVASYYGSGYCPAVSSCVYGDGVFDWPVGATQITQEYNAAIHPAIDVGGVEAVTGVYAADTGVVVYAGWSEYGYGNLVVIDHGYSQTVYAHLFSYSVSCGQSVYRGAQIGMLGNTGNSSGPHLHFEININGYGKVNPLDYVSP